MSTFALQLIEMSSDDTDISKNVSKNIEVVKANFNWSSILSLLYAAYARNLKVRLFSSKYLKV